MTDESLPATYVVQYTVFLADYTNVSVNSAGTLTVEVVDPCLPPILTLTASTLVDQEYFITDTPLVYTFDAFTVYESWCVFTYSYVSSDVAVDAAISFDDTLRTFTVDYSSDLSMAGISYTISVTGTRLTVSDTASFTLLMKNPCEEPSLN